jgi:hypothetical protein
MEYLDPLEENINSISHTREGEPLVAVAFHRRLCNGHNRRRNGKGEIMITTLVMSTIFIPVFILAPSAARIMFLSAGITTC